MLRRFRSHLTYSNVTVTILAFIVLGGSAYAVAIAPRNSVVSSSIKNGAVKSSDVKNRSLKLSDLNLPNVDQGLGDISSGLVKLTAGVGNPNLKPIVKAGPFTVQARCAGDPASGHASAQTNLYSSNGGRYTAVFEDTSKVSGNGSYTSVGSGAILAAGGSLTTSGVQTEFMVIANDGTTLTGTLAEYVHAFKSDCAFDFVGRLT
jgi:hypothetical protein